MSTYHWNAKDYEKHSQAQQKWARELIEKLSLKGTEDVLDLGCGDGKVTAEIASQLNRGSVVGVDNSSAMIKLAQERYPKTAHPNLSFQVMDASHITFNECFDVVFSNAALHWVKDHKPVVAGLSQCLKPGGKILLQMGGEGNAQKILSVLAEVQAENQWQIYFKEFAFPYGFLGVEAYNNMLLENGFNIKRVELIPKDMQHPGKEGLAGWIRTTWLPYTERVPENLRDDFIDAIAAKYIDTVPMDTNGIVHVEMVRIEVEAEKSRA